jgi:hypothetical protein
MHLAALSASLRGGNSEFLILIEFYSTGYRDESKDLILQKTANIVKI